MSDPFRCLLILVVLIGTVSCSSFPPDKKEPNLHPASIPIRLYQRVISPIDSGRCHMSPSCSSYSLDAFERHGLLVGWVMTCDRLIRCGGDEFAVSGSRELNGKHYCNDTVDNNDFWWYTKEEKPE